MKIKTRIIPHVQLLGKADASLEFLDFPMDYGPELLPLYDNHIGINVLSQFYTLMDFVQKRVYFKSLLALDNKFKVGVKFSPDAEGRMIVLDTAAGSSAREAGVLAGDEILAVNGKSLPLEPAELAQAFNQPEGAQMTLKVQRKGENKPREFNLTFRKL